MNTREEFFEMIHDEADKKNLSVDELVMIWADGLVAFEHDKQFTLENIRKDLVAQRKLEDFKKNNADCANKLCCFTHGIDPDKDLETITSVEQRLRQMAQS